MPRVVEPRCFLARSSAALILPALLAAWAFPCMAAPGESPNGAETSTPPKRPNIILVLSDDHRYNFMGFAEGSPDFLETPAMDRMAAQGAQFENMFVCTSLCSPSRASFLTGQYTHRHRVVDNQRPVPEGTVFFPAYLQQAGYETAYIGKWHMGHDDDSPRKGFDHWVSFRGQGDYFNPTLNINGKRSQLTGYTTDVLTDQAIEWLERDHDRPFMLYLGFKAVHYPFEPAKRHHGRYENAKIEYPETMADTERNYETQPHWVRERRFGIHGIDHMQTGPLDHDPVPSFDDWYHRYCETIHGLDENLGRLLDAVDRSSRADSTIVIYTSDNGFALGEHGFYDKRDAFEESIRVPMLAYAPGLIKPGTKIPQMVQNIDVAPTILDLAGVPVPEAAKMDGRSAAPLLRGEELPQPWRDEILYEYYWEWNFPATPTVFALRGERYKYIYYHGVWDRNGFYDLETDPHEQHNLIRVPVYQELIGVMRKRLFDKLEAADGMQVPFRRPAGDKQYYDRKLHR